MYNRMHQLVTVIYSRTYKLNELLKACTGVYTDEIVKELCKLDKDVDEYNEVSHAYYENDGSYYFIRCEIIHRNDRKIKAIFEWSII